jgi:GNAT superfamily N-acetyltransferase
VFSAVLNIEIRRPKTEDIDNLHQFFEKVIVETFTKEGIGDQLEDIENETETKKNYLLGDLESNGRKRFFLIAFHSEKIIGSIEHGPASELICQCTQNAYIGIPEIGTVFVHPEYQRLGIGNLLLKAMYNTLKSEGIEEVCLDSGYSRAQKIWNKKFGEPEFLLKDYWGEGFDHMIWKVKVSDLI